MQIARQRPKAELSVDWRRFLPESEDVELKGAPVLTKCRGCLHRQSARHRGLLMCTCETPRDYFLAVAVISTCPGPTSLDTTTVVRAGLGSVKYAL